MIGTDCRNFRIVSTIKKEVNKRYTKKKKLYKMLIISPEKFGNQKMAAYICTVVIAKETFPAERSAQCRRRAREYVAETAAGHFFIVNISK